jgi:hypothetical protein
MDLLDKMVEAIELHDVESIRSCFADGLDPNTEFRGEPLLYELTSEYTRSPKFTQCVQAFVDAGLHFNDPILRSLLLDDAEGLEIELNKDPAALHRSWSLRCAYTPLYHASLLHIAAEFNLIRCARLLLAKGVDVNAKAGVDENGFGAQTPIFHCVNQNNHQSADVLHLLLEHSADLLYTVKGLVWGRSYEWETFIPAVNPISYCMMGLLPQMHRRDITIAEVVSLLLKQAYGIDYMPQNIPNAYLGH